MPAPFIRLCNQPWGRKRDIVDALQRVETFLSASSEAFEIVEAHGHAEAVASPLMDELFDAIRSGDAGRVGDIIDSDRSLASATSRGVSAILTAIYHGKADIARLLVDRGATLSIHEAAALGDLEKVRSMLAADPASLNRKGDDGFAPLGLAIFFRHPEVAEFLIEQGADVNAAADNAQRVAPVHAAAAVCDRATMGMLLDRGADPNARQQADFTPLHGAASRGDIEMAKLLVEHGADRKAKNADDMTALEIAEKYKQPAFADWFRGLK